jgi:hypothetical protein
LPNRKLGPVGQDETVLTVSAAGVERRPLHPDNYRGFSSSDKRTCRDCVESSSVKEELPMLSRFLTANLTICLVLGMASRCAAESPRMFEFLDDFRKPRHLQREPFEERIETERHDFTQSATTVGRHVMQIESGYSFLYKEQEGEEETTHTFPEMLLRVGISEDVEVRLRWNHVWRFVEEDEDLLGSEDLRYSVKLQLTRQRCGSLLPTSALELRGSAPTAGEPFSTGDPQLGVDTIYQWQVGEGITIAGSTGLGTNGLGNAGLLPVESRDDDFVNWTQSAVLGMEVSEANTLYAEWFGIFSDGLEDDYSISVVNFGIDHYFSDDFVGDLRAGTGLTDDTDDLFIGIGGGYRF